jgi:D-alanyl-D-alanine carboxypeptidase
MHRSFTTLLLATTLLTGSLAAAPASAAPEDAAAPTCGLSVAALRSFGSEAIEAGLPGMVVAISRPGEPALIEAFGQADVEHAAPMRPDAAFRIASLTKQFTAALVLSLVEEGRLNLDDPAVLHLPELVWLGEITVRQLLVQTSGLPDYAGDPNGQATKAAARPSAEMLDWIGRLALRPDFPPGTRWAYSNSNYAVLGALVERLTGAAFDEAIRRRVLEPARLSATRIDDPQDLVPHRARGYSARPGRPLRLANAVWIHPSIPGPGGALRSTAADLLRWNDALYSAAVIRPATLAEMVSPGRLQDGRTTRFGMPDAWREGLKSDYAMGLFVSDSLLGARVWHGGDIDGFVSWMARYPERDVTIVVLRNGDFTDVNYEEIERIVADASPC